MSSFLLLSGNGLLILSWILLLGCGCYGICRGWIGSDAGAAGVVAGGVDRSEEPAGGRRSYDGRAPRLRIERHSLANCRGCLE